MRITPIHNTVYNVAFSPIEPRIASGNADETVWIWNTETGKAGLVLEGHEYEVQKVAYSLSGDQIATCGEDGSVRLWCSQTGETPFRLPGPKRVEQLQYSPDGLRLIVSGKLESVRYWHPRSDKKVLPFRMVVSFSCWPCSPDGKILATVDLDETLRLWDLSNGGRSEVYRSWFGGTVWMKWRHCSNGVYMAAKGMTGSIRVWKLRKEQDEYDIQLLWGMGLNQLVLADSEQDDIVGLSPLNKELMEQRATVDSP